METQLTLFLFQKNNKKHWENVAFWVLENNKQEELITLFSSNDKRISQRASAIFMTLADIDSNTLLPFQNQLVEILLNKPTSAQKRNIFRLFQIIYPNKSVEGNLLDACFRALENITEPIAVRVFAMTVAFRIGVHYPEILPELKTLIINNIELRTSAGLENRGKKILTKISRIL